METQQRLHVCKICGKQLATLNGVSGHMRIHSASSLSHVCKICGKKFVTSKSLCNHKRIHSGQRNRMVDENDILFLLWICGLYSVSASSMTEIEQDEMNEAAMSLVMFSEQVYDFPPPLGDSSMEAMQENILHCVESKEEFGELVSHSKSSTCSDVAVPSPLTSELQKKPESKSSHKCRICGKTFSCYQALGGHQRLHRGQLARKREDLEGGNSLSGLSQVKKIVSQPSRFEVSQAELTELRDTNEKEHCVESKEEFSEMLKSSSTCSDVVAQALHSPQLQDKPESNSSYRCQICGKMLGCFQELGDHQRLHRGQLVRKREDFEGGIVSQPSSFEVSQEKLIELADNNVKENCVESEVDFEKSSDVFVAKALLPSPLRSKLQGKPETNSSRVCRICGKTFWCYQALGGHQRLHRGQIARQRILFEDGNSLSDSLEAKKIFSQESSFEILM